MGWLVAIILAPIIFTIVAVYALLKLAAAMVKLAFAPARLLQR
jgi:hypothetical protein